MPPIEEALAGAQQQNQQDLSGAGRGAISSLGVGSGLDLEDTVQQLVQAERMPEEQRINRNAERAEEQLSALGKLRQVADEFSGGIDGLTDLSAFTQMNAESSDPDLFTAEAEEDAPAGSFSVQVDQLAQSQRIASEGYDEPDSEIGTGTLTLETGDGEFDVVIDEDNNTVEAIRDEINTAAGNDGDVTASLFNTDEGVRLVLESEGTGEENAVEISSSGGDGGLASLEFDPEDPDSSDMEVIREAQDAVAFVDGFEQRSADNTLDDVIEGVSINLQSADEDAVETLDISRDEQGARESIQQFVDGYNQLIGQMNELTDFDPEEEDAAPLQGDSTARQFVSQLRGVLNTQVEGLDANFSSLAELGIVSTREGTLEVDQDRLDQAMSEDFEAVGQLFGGEQGVATRMDEVVEQYTGFDGLLENRESGLQNRLSALDDQMDRLDERMERVEARYTEEFANMDSLVAELQQTGNFLQQRLGQGG